MATTRAKTGNSKPRTLADQVQEAVAKPKITKKKAATAVKKATDATKSATKSATKTATSKAGAATKANTGKPREKKVATGRVAKPTATKKTTTTTEKKATTAKKSIKKAAPAAKKAEKAEKEEKAEKSDKTTTAGHAEPNHEPTLLEDAKDLALKVADKVTGLVTGQSAKKVQQLPS